MLEVIKLIVLLDVLVKFNVPTKQLGSEQKLVVRILKVHKFQLYQLTILQELTKCDLNKDSNLAIISVDLKTSCFPIN